MRGHARLGKRPLLLALRRWSNPIATGFDDCQRILEHFRLYSGDEGVEDVTYLMGCKGRGYPQNDDSSMRPQRVFEQVAKSEIARDDDPTFFLRVGKDSSIRCSPQTDISHVARVAPLVPESIRG